MGFREGRVEPCTRHIQRRVHTSSDQRIEHDWSSGQGKESIRAVRDGRAVMKQHEPAEILNADNESLNQEDDSTPKCYQACYQVIRR